MILTSDLFVTLGRLISRDGLTGTGDSGEAIESQYLKNNTTKRGTNGLE